MLVTEASDIAEEYYVSFLLDRANRTYLAMASVEGGMEIEQLAVERPEALARVAVDALRGVDAGQGRARSSRPPASRPTSPTRSPRCCQQLWAVFVEEDATLVEVNPLVRTPDGRIVALDGKVTLDANAEFRHADVFARVRGPGGRRRPRGPGQGQGPQLRQARRPGRDHRQRRRAWSCRTLDVVAYAGEDHGGVKPANFLDIGGGASAQVMADGLEIILADPDVRSVFVNVFGGITSCDAVANGIVQALGMLGRRRRPSRSSCGSTATTSRRAAAILAEAAHPLVTRGRHDGRRGRQGRRARAQGGLTRWRSS